MSKKDNSFTGNQIKQSNMVLGESISKFELPEQFTNDINNLYDKSKDMLPDWNTELAGKIKKESLVNPILTDDMNKIFKMCFHQYMVSSGLFTLRTQKLKLDNAWINEMKAGEYNPAHFHSGKASLLGLSSVLFLKIPSTYGKEASNDDQPANGHLEFIGGNQHTLAISQYRLNPKVGDFFVFPYTLVHTVYPFNGTDEVRRTLSYNCDIIPQTEQDIKEQNMQKTHGVSAM